MPRRNYSGPALIIKTNRGAYSKRTLRVNEIGHRGAMMCSTTCAWYERLLKLATHSRPELLSAGMPTCKESRESYCFCKSNVIRALSGPEQQQQTGNIDEIKSDQHLPDTIGTRRGSAPVKWPESQWQRSL